MVKIGLHIAIVISNNPKRNSKGKRREPTYPRALYRIRGIVQGVVHRIMLWRGR